MHKSSTHQSNLVSVSFTWFPLRRCLHKNFALHAHTYFTAKGRRTPSAEWCNCEKADLNTWTGVCGNLLCKSESFGEQTTCVEQLPKKQILYWVHLQSCHLGTASKISSDHTVFYLYIKVCGLESSSALVQKETKWWLKWVIARCQASECIFESLVLMTALLCKQTLACTNHSEGGEQFGSPWQMSGIVWEYESPCSPIKPILFLFRSFSSLALLVRPPPAVCQCHKAGRG